ncbi:MAG TPA: 2-oxoacid:acceptor oxidoreductase family protein [Candidatus Methylomirabilis sp.]|nr:2-oxoacid:acceptor oxidoreductase family protein [Candidatus Methylomirabilis sp.]
MRQRIIISGRGGQGVLTLTRILAEGAVAAGHEVITTETHGMAQRGGAVISMVKVGPFHGPLIAPGEAEVGFFLHAANLPVHGHYLRAGAAGFVNGTAIPGHTAVDAAGLARKVGSPRAANLVLLGYAAGTDGLFAGPALFEAVIRATTPPRNLDQNLAAFSAGVEAAG